MKICPKCNSKHNKDGTFCSRSCANSRGPRSAEFKEHISNAPTGRIGHPSIMKGIKTAEYEIRKCPHCLIEFSVRKSNKKLYCSHTCAKIYAGGYREGSGRAKTGYYKGIYCGSTYELVWVVYNLDNNITFSRFDGCLEKDGLKYFPDFITDKNHIVEIKGFENKELVDKKTALAESVGYTVSVLYKQDLLYAFNWAKSKYSYKSLQELYDNYKPQCTYTCAHCDSIFSRLRPIKTKTAFCSKVCAGTGHTGRNVLGTNRYTNKLPSSNG